MKFYNVLMVLAMSVMTNAALAQDTTAAPKTVPNRIRPYNEVITAKAVTKQGLFSVHKVDEKYYFEIPDSLLKREFLFTTRLVKVPTGSPLFGGELVNSIIVAFEKASEEKLYLRVVTNVAISNSSDAIAKAVRNSTIDPIVMVMDIKAKGKNGSSVVIEVTDFVLKDNNITGFDPTAKRAMGLGGSAADRSFILSTSSFDQNIEIKTVKTFSLGAAPKPAEGAVDAAPAPVSTASNVTMELSNSIMLLPNQQMQARHADPRIGYFSENYKVFSDAQQKVEERNFIVRQRLEPRPEDLERYKKGELVEPKEPIVYYIDPATPKQWRPYIIAGINDWNEAFKAAGFKTAIIGKEWDEDDTTMSLEDARCKLVRYFPSEQSFSSTPRIYDPRSGEILQTYIGWSHSKMKSLQEWYFVQASAADPRARTMTFSNELMGALIRADISRQVGYSLGLRNNLIASTAYPVEKLRDKKFVEANGFSASIMDNIHYNYVAQPEDKMSPKGMVPQISAYDKWMIKYGYTYTGNNDFDQEKKTVLDWINKVQANNPSLKFGADRDVNQNEPFDPRSLSEDLGDNPVKAGEYAIKNMKIVMDNLLKWTKEDMDMYDNTARMYDNVMDWWLIIMRHAFTQLGGVKEDLKTVEQSGDVYTPVSKEMQKQAMAFLQKEVFQTPTWLLDPTVLNKFSKPAKREKVQRFQAETVYQLMKPSRLYQISAEEMRYGKTNMYTLEEMMTDIDNGVWSELKTTNPVISANRRSLQKSWLENINRVLKDASTTPAPGSSALDLTNTDVPVIIRAHMEKIMKQCKAAAVNCKDPMTLAHILYTQGKLNKLLNPKN
jgi:hypothetical protein